MSVCVCWRSTEHAITQRTFVSWYTVTSQYCISRTSSASRPASPRPASQSIRTVRRTQNRFPTTSRWNSVATWVVHQVRPCRCCCTTITRLTLAPAVQFSCATTTSASARRGSIVARRRCRCSVLPGRRLHRHVRCRLAAASCPLSEQEAKFSVVDK